MSPIYIYILAIYSICSTYIYIYINNTQIKPISLIYICSGFMQFWFQILISNISQQAVTKAPNLISLHALRKIYEPRSGMGRWGRGRSCRHDRMMGIVLGILPSFSWYEFFQHANRCGTCMIMFGQDREPINCNIEVWDLSCIKTPRTIQTEFGNPISGYFWTSSCSFDSPPARWGPLDLDNTSRGYPPTYTLTHIPATPSPSCHLPRHHVMANLFASLRTRRLFLPEDYAGLNAK